MSKEQQRFYKLYSYVCVALMLLFQIYQVNGIECGTVNFPQPTVIDGSQTVQGEWPFIAALLHNNQSKFFCGGTIISNRHVLTAAHCVMTKTRVILAPDDIEVRLGAFDLSRTNARQVILRNVTEILVHPEWDMYEEVDEVYDADIAILVLSDSVVFTNYIRPICLPSDQDEIDGVTINFTGKIVGWGLSESGTYEEIPRQASIKTLIDSYCYRRKHIMASLASARTFCGVYGDGIPSRGDSGGGLFVISNSTWVQYGIISSSSTNNTGQIDRNSLSLYTNVKSYKSWIEKVLKSSTTQLNISAAVVTAEMVLPNGNNFSVGSEIAIDCNVSGYPVSFVHWFKYGVELAASDRIQITKSPHRLTISDVNFADAGYYKCLACNELSCVSSGELIIIDGVYVSANCTDNPHFANCRIITIAKYCQHKYYTKFCCKTCTLAGQLNFTADQVY